MGGLNEVFQPQVFHVDSIDVSGDEINDWEYSTTYEFHKGEIFLLGYRGTKKNIIVPASINGKKIAFLDHFSKLSDSVESIEFPGIYEYIPTCLYGAHNLKSITIGEGVRALHADFLSQLDLESLRISQSVDMVYGSFYDRDFKCFKIQGDYVIAGRVLVCYRGNDQVVKVPSGVKTVASTIAPFRKIREVVLPETVTTLCDYAFNGASNGSIEKFVYTESLINIGEWAMGIENKWIEQLISHGQHVIINNQLYKSAPFDKTITIPDGITHICDRVFYESKDLETVVLPVSLKSIGKEAFCGCFNLKKIEWPDGLVRLESGCFQACKKISNVILPNSLVHMGDSAFYYCTSLKEVTLGKSVEHIGKKAFSTCSKLHTIIMNNSLKTIGSEAFSNCSSIESISFPDTVIEIGEKAFEKCPSLVSVTIPHNINTIRYGTFLECTSLQDIELARVDGIDVLS